MIKKKKPLPECKDRYFEPASNGYGGIIKDVMTPCCPLKSTSGDINCYAVLGAGKCPHHYDYPRDPPPFDPANFKASPWLIRQIEEEEKEVQRDNEMLAYLSEIDPLES